MTAAPAHQGAIPQRMHRPGTRARTLSPRRANLTELRAARAALPVVDHERPKTRGECTDGARPCPFVSCRYHLYLDVTPATGALKLNFPDLEVEGLKQSCALDVADEGPQTLEQVGELMNVTRERVRQIEARTMPVLRRRLEREGLTADDVLVERHEDANDWVTMRVPVRLSSEDSSPPGAADARDHRGGDPDPKVERRDEEATTARAGSADIDESPAEGSAHCAAPASSTPPAGHRLTDDEEDEMGASNGATSTEGNAGAAATKARARTLTHDGRTDTINGWAERIGCSRALIELRLKQGKPIAEVLAPKGQPRGPRSAAPSPASPRRRAPPPSSSGRSAVPSIAATTSATTIVDVLKLAGFEVLNDVRVPNGRLLLIREEPA